MNGALYGITRFDEGNVTIHKSAFNNSLEGMIPAVNLVQFFQDSKCRLHIPSEHFWETQAIWAKHERQFEKLTLMDVVQCDIKYLPKKRFSFDEEKVQFNPWIETNPSPYLIPEAEADKVAAEFKKQYVRVGMTVDTVKRLLQPRRTTLEVLHGISSQKPTYFEPRQLYSGIPPFFNWLTERPAKMFEIPKRCAKFYTHYEIPGVRWLGEPTDSVFEHEFHIARRQRPDDSYNAPAVLRVYNRQDQKPDASQPQPPISTINVEA